MIVIKTATTKDASLIADLSRQTFYESFAADNTKEDMDKFMTEQFSRELLMAEVGAARNIFFLAYDENNEPIGYTRLRENNIPPELGVERALEIARIYAVKKAIGKGVGKALMNASLAYARDHHYQTVWLGVWEHNQRAIDFYTKWGFQKFSEHEFILGNDVQTDWLMFRKI